MVDEFRVKYVGKKHADHLIIDKYHTRALSSINNLGRQTLLWHQNQVELSKHVFYLSIPRYIQAALHKFQHNPATRKEHVPHIWERPNYVAKQQFAKAEDTSQKLPPERIQVL